MTETLVVCKVIGAPVLQSTFWAGQATRDCSWACHNVWKDIVGQAAELQLGLNMHWQDTHASKSFGED